VVSQNDIRKTFITSSGDEDYETDSRCYPMEAITIFDYLLKISVLNYKFPFILRHFQHLAGRSSVEIKSYIERELSTFELIDVDGNGSLDMV
jgi:hypothetical protein